MTPDHFLLLIFVLASLSSLIFTIVQSAEITPRTEKYIIKDCNSIQYRFMADWGEPPFPDTACDIKKVSIYMQWLS